MTTSGILELPRIKTWSFSLLRDFETCPYRAYLRAVKRIRDEGNKNSNRGTEIHTAAEHFIQGQSDTLPKTLTKSNNYLTELRGEYDKGNVIVEENWGFDADWGITGFFDDDVWCRMKLDALAWCNTERSFARVIDHKSGKSFGKEVAHGQQGQLYSIGAFMRYPTLQAVEVEFNYTDEGKISRKSYTRKQGLALLPGYTKRGLIVTSATAFPAKSNRMNCKWCPYGPTNGNDTCEYGFEA